MTKTNSMRVSYFLFFLLFLGGLGRQTLVAQGMTLKEFEAHALEEKDEVWVVDFWASWCRPCMQAMPHFKETVEKYAGKKVRFVSLSYDDNKANWQGAIDHFGMTWDQILLPNRQPVAFIEKNFKHKTIPTCFIVSREGKVKKVPDVYEVEAAIEKALAK